MPSYLSTTDDFASCLNEGGPCDVLFLNFSKAFDRVPHSRLLYKLNHYGIRGPLLKWLESFLTNRSQHVILNNRTSHETSVLSGIPQGTVLAPLLFLLYVNDLPQCIRNKIKLYADDVLLYSVTHSEADCVRLQEDLKLLHQWSILWQMEFNPSKCEFLQMTNKRNPIKYQYSISDAVIQQVTHAKYLGVTIDEKLSWNEHILKVTNKARQVNTFLRRNISNCPIHVKCNIYKIMVRPILEYGSTIWDPHTHLNIESIQRTAAKFYYNNYFKLSSVSGMLNQLGLPTLQQRRKRSKCIMMLQDNYMTL